MVDNSRTPCMESGVWSPVKWHLSSIQRSQYKLALWTETSVVSINRLSKNRYNHHVQKWTAYNKLLEFSMSVFGSQHSMSINVSGSQRTGLCWINSFSYYQTLLKLKSWKTLIYRFESILFDWQHLIESRGGFTIGEILIAKARDIWRSLPQYKDKPEPHSSSGWLHRFKQRHNIESQNRHGEAGSITQEAEEEMAGICTISREFNGEDIYNMDETGLFRKQAVIFKVVRSRYKDWSLASEYGRPR